MDKAIDYDFFLWDRSFSILGPNRTIWWVMAVVQKQDKYLVVFNPVADKKRFAYLQKLLNLLRDNGIDWELYPTSASLDANRHYFENHLEDVTDIIVLGGDGTFHQVVNCLYQIKQDVRVGLLPAGTGNDFARAWYGKKYNNVKYILSVISDTYTEKARLGLCHFPEKEGRFQRRIFHNVLGAGFDAALAKKLTGRKGLFKNLTYLLSAVFNIAFYKERVIDLRQGPDRFRYDNLITVFANSPFFGGGLKIAPDASPKRSSLDICRAAKMPFLTKMGLILKLCFGKHTGAKQVEYYRFDGKSIIASKGLDIEADGEYLGTSPCEIQIADFQLNLKR